MARQEPSNFKLDIVSQKAETKAPDTSSETKKMTGFSDISAVAAAAPDKASSETATPTRSRAAAGASPRVRQKAEEVKKQEEKDKRVEEALSKVGTAMMRELAQLPYEAWAFFFSDPYLKLDAKQSEELANSYYLIFQALKPEQLTDWKVLLALALLQNFRIVIVKLREHTERVDKAKKAAASMGQQVDLQNAPDVTIV